MFEEIDAFVAIFSIIYGLVGIVGILIGFLIIQRRYISKMVGSLDDISETVEALNTTVRNASEFLGGSSELLEGISRIFYDIGGSLPLVGRSFRELGRNLGTISANMHGFRQSIDSFENKWGDSLEKVGGLRKGGIPKIKVLIGVLLAWLIGLHLILVLIGLTLL